MPTRQLLPLQGLLILVFYRANFISPVYLIALKWQKLGSIKLIFAWRITIVDQFGVFLRATISQKEI